MKAPSSQTRISPLPTSPPNSARSASRRSARKGSDAISRNMLPNSHRVRQMAIAASDQCLFVTVPWLFQVMNRSIEPDEWGSRLM